MDAVKKKKQVFKPVGARLLVDLIVTSLSLEERGRIAGLEIVVENDNRPKPTTGIVIALGTDPFLHEHVKVGDKVFFSPYAGHDTVLNGKEFRMLEWQEITGVMTEEES